LGVERSVWERRGVFGRGEECLGEERSVRVRSVWERRGVLGLEVFERGV
jgi:hypothetical protein